MQVIILATTILVSFFHNFVSENNTKCPSKVCFVYIRISTYNWVIGILAYTLKWNFKNPFKNWIQNYCASCFPYHAVQKKKPWSGHQSCICKCIPHCVHPLLRCMKSLQSKPCQRFWLNLIHFYNHALVNGCTKSAYCMRNVHVCRLKAFTLFGQSTTFWIFFTT